jgi:hypothetical protein
MLWNVYVPASTIFVVQIVCQMIHVFLPFLMMSAVPGRWQKPRHIVQQLSKIFNPGHCVGRQPVVVACCCTRRAGLVTKVTLNEPSYLYKTNVMQGGSALQRSTRKAMAAALTDRRAGRAGSTFSCAQPGFQVSTADCSSYLYKKRKAKIELKRR